MLGNSPCAKFKGVPKLFLAGPENLRIERLPHHKHSSRRTGRRIRFLAKVPVSFAKKDGEVSHWRATGVTVYLENGGRLEHAQQSHFINDFKDVTGLAPESYFGHASCG
jgi:hypothetical protein